MKMEHYLAHTDYPVCEVIQNGNGPVSISTDTQGQIKILPPKSAEEILARERERKARTTLLMALPEDHLAKFHKMTDAKVLFSDAETDDSWVDINNLDTYFQVSPVPTTRIHKYHPLNQVIGDLQSATHTRLMTKILEAYDGMLRSAFLLESYKRKSMVYVDDIIFGSTKKSLCTEFEKMMHKKFQMSSIGELIFFLGMQVKQKEDRIFISQNKYVTKILKKFGFSDVKTASTPMETHKPLLKDVDREDINEHMYRSMIGSLMYLTSSRPDIMFVHPKDSPFDLVAYTDSDYARASLDRKSTTGGYQFLGCRLISWQCKKQTVVANSTT
ncbi:uncharacterized mitochondrial protein-like protein [Tanacetum coccineum]